MRASRSALEWQTILFSLFMHLAVSGAFALFSSIQAPVATEIEVITLQPGPLKESHPQLSRSQRRSNSQDRKVLAEEKSPNVAQVKTASSEEQKEIEGRSDISEGFVGRTPKNEKERYLAEVRSQIAKLQTYPNSSRMFGEQGTVQLLLTIKRNGSLVKVEIIRESAFERLNNAAISAATKAAPFRSFPLDVPFDLWRISLPIQFALSRN